MITGAIPAEYVGTPGLISNVVTKSGSNMFTGSVNYFFQNSNLVSENQNGPDDEFSTKDNGYTIGGPILHNKAWFFGSYRFTNREDDVSTLDTREFLRSVGNTQHQGFAKASWAPTTADLFSFTYLSDPTEITGRRERDITNARDRGVDQGGHRFGGLFTRVWGSTLLEVGANKHNGELSQKAPSVNPSTTSSSSARTRGRWPTSSSAASGRTDQRAPAPRAIRTAPSTTTARSSRRRAPRKRPRRGSASSRRTSSR